MCRFRSIATCELQAEAAGAELSASHETVKTFLAGLQYEASKGYINIQVCAPAWKPHHRSISCGHNAGLLHGGHPKIPEILAYWFTLIHDYMSPYTCLCCCAQGRERFADFAARHAKQLVSRERSERLSDIAEGVSFPTTTPLSI